MAYTISQIKQENAAAGFYFFSPTTMRFFKSKVLPQVYEGPGGVFFITSEQPPNEPRQYNVRRFDPQTGRVDSVDGAGWIRHEEDARDAAKMMAQAGPRMSGLLVDEMPPDVGPAGADYGSFGHGPDFHNPAARRALNRATRFFQESKDFYAQRDCRKAVGRFTDAEGSLGEAFTHLMSMDPETRAPDLTQQHDDMRDEFTEGYAILRRNCFRASPSPRRRR